MNENFLLMVLRWFYENHGMLQIPVDEKSGRLPVQRENDHRQRLAQNTKQI